MRHALYVALTGLSSLLFPLGSSLVALVLAGLARRMGRPRLAAALAIMATGWLWTWSTPTVADAIRHRLEARYPYRPAESYPQADVIVVLGGGVEGAAVQGRPVPDLNAAADREWFAARLYHAGKAPRVLVSAGVTPGGLTEPAADGMAAFLAALGVPADSIMLERRARNTLENARYVTDRLAGSGATRILLVTSAFHMPRAMRLFASSPLLITPAPTDYEVLPSAFAIRRLLPSARALNRSTDALKEYVGIWAAGVQEMLLRRDAVSPTVR